MAILDDFLASGAQSPSTLGGAEAFERDQWLRLLQGLGGGSGRGSQADPYSQQEIETGSVQPRVGAFVRGADGRLRRLTGAPGPGQVTWRSEAVDEATPTRSGNAHLQVYDAPPPSGGGGGIPPDVLQRLLDQSASAPDNTLAGTQPAPTPLPAPDAGIVAGKQGDPSIPPRLWHNRADGIVMPPSTPPPTQVPPVLPSARAMAAELEQAGGAGSPTIGPFATTVTPEAAPPPPSGPDADAIVRGAVEAAADRPPSRQAPQGPGGLQGWLRNLFLAMERGDSRASETENMTAQALIARGVDPNLATAIARQPQLLQQVLPSIFGRGAPLVLGPGQVAFDAQGRPLARGGPPQLPDGVRTRLTEQGDQLSTVRRLGSSFQDSYSMPNTVIGGDMRNWAARNAPLLSSENGRRAAEWWQAYERDSQLVERHALFGAALTATEQAAWRSADINPNMSPEMIRTSLRRRQEILTGALRRYARGLTSEGHSLQTIAQYLGVPQSMLTGEGGGGGGGGVRTYNPQTGQLE